MTAMLAKLTNNICAIVTVSLLGCGDGEGYLIQQYKLECTPVDGELVTFCIEEQKGCVAPLALQACSWNLHTDLDHASVTYFEHSLLESTACEEGWLKGARFPSDPNSTCGSPEVSGSGGGSGGGGESTAEPEPTGGESTGESTGEPVEEVYLCARNIPHKCADLLPDDVLAGYGDNYKDPYIDPEVPSHSEKDACWGLINPDAPPIWSPCVSALDAGMARAKCDVICSTYQDDINNKVKAVCGDNNPDCRVVTEVDCAMDGIVNGDMDAFDAPEKLAETPGWECDGEVMVPVWDGVSELKLFEGAAALVTRDGLTVGMGNLTGFVGYTLPNCGPNDTICQIDFDALQLLTHFVEGGYTDALGNGGTYTVDRMGLQALNVFSGTWYKSRGTISFPTAVIQAQIWGGDTTLNGDTVPGQFGVSVVVIDQIVGNLDSLLDPLSLNLTYNAPEGTVSFSLRGQ